MITKEKFDIFEDIKNRGFQDMSRIDEVVKLSKGKLKYKECLEIYRSYINLKQIYGRNNEIKT